MENITMQTRCQELRAIREEIRLLKKTIPFLFSEVEKRMYEEKIEELREKEKRLLFNKNPYERIIL